MNENCAGKKSYHDIFTNSQKQDFLSLYGNNRKQNNRFNTKINARDVLLNVFSQIKVIQNADRNACRNHRKSVPNSLKESSFIPVTDLSSKYEDEMPISPRAETSCLIDNKQSLIEYAGHSQMLAGLTEEFNSTFNQNDNENILDRQKYQNSRFSDDPHLESLKNVGTFNRNIEDKALINYDGVKSHIKNDKCTVTSGKEDVVGRNKIISCNTSIDSDLFEIDTKNYYFCDESSDNETEINKNSEAQFSGTHGTDNNSGGGSSNKTLMLNESIEVESNNSPIIIDQPNSPVLVPKRTQNKSFSFDVGESLVFDLGQFERFERKAQSMLENTYVNKRTALRKSQAIDEESIVLEDSHPGFNGDVKEQHSRYEKDEGSIKKRLNEEININDDFSIIVPSNDRIKSPVIEYKDRIKSPIIEYKDNNINKESTVQENSQTSLNGIFKEEFPKCVKDNNNIEKEFKEEIDKIGEDFLLTVPSCDGIKSPIIEFKGNKILLSRKESWFNFNNNAGQAEVECKKVIVDDEFHDDERKCTNSTVDEIVVSSDEELYCIGIQNMAKTFEESEIFFPGLDKQIEETNFKDRVSTEQGFTDDNTFNVTLEKNECEIFFSEHSDCAVILENEYNINKFDTNTVLEGKNTPNEITNASRMEKSDENLSNIDNKEMFDYQDNQRIELTKEATVKTENIFLSFKTENENYLTETESHKINISTNNLITSNYKNENLQIKNISDVMADKFSHTENDNRTLSNKIGCKTANDEEYTNFDSNIEALHENNYSTLSSNDFIGFKTANKRENAICNEALTLTKDIFEDIEEDFLLQLKCLEESYKDGPAENNCRTPRREYTDFMGFKTNNNKEITISKEALAETKNIFNDNETDSRLQSNTLSKPDTESMNDIENNNKLLGTNSFTGFKTANNKEITISKEALTKTKNIFNDIEKDSQLQSNTLSKPDTDSMNDIENNNKLLSTNSFTGFKTANNKEITISKEALAKTKNIFNDIEKDSQLQSNTLSKPDTESMNDIENNNKLLSTNSFTGFKTANNKEITISKEALAKTKNIFEDIEKDSQLQLQCLKEINHCDKKQEGVHNVNTAFMNNSEFMNNRSLGKNSVMGFKTANNKKITISKEALAKTKNIFDDIDKDSQLHMKCLKENNHCDKKQEGVHNTVSKNDTENNCRSLNKSIFMGFKTAHNKKIIISEDALAKTKNIFKDIEKDSRSRTKCQKENMASLQHSSGKSTHTDITENNSCGAQNKKCFVGFKTASNKEITISKEALAKTKNVFENIDKDCLLQAKCYHKNETEGQLNNGESNPMDDPTELKFYGFKSASNKDIHVSAKALDKTRDIFKDIDVVRLKQDRKITEGAFQTANNNKISISKTALARTRKIFEEIDKCKENRVNVNIELNNEKALGKSKRANDNFKVLSSGATNFLTSSLQTTTKKTDATDLDMETSYYNSRDEELIMDNFIDTQIRSELEKSICTEGFISPKAKKRCASPVLLCRSEKRCKRFQVPRKSSLKIIDDIMDVTVEKSSRFHRFDGDYKKRKKYSLKDLKRMETESMTKPSFDPYVFKFNFDDKLLNFEFSGRRNGMTNEKLLVKDLKEIFLESVKRDIIPDGWIENHMKLILWKLINYERNYPMTLQFVCTARNVIEQLKYRYDRELYKVERPALRKILEKDDVSTKTLILIVLVIYQDDVSVDSVKSASNIELLVTDGWYTVKATIDKTLSKLVFDGKIKIGTKIVTNGAELVNCDQGMTPWEDTSQVRLKLHGNSTRRAHFDARLGFTGHAAILSHLSNVTLDGGKVSKLRLYVTRVYPTLYVEKLENGSTVTRSERMEYVHQTKYDAERQSLLEQKYEEVERELSDEDSQDTETKCCKRTCLETGSQIAMVMKKCIDPIEFQERLTKSQSHLLADYLNKKRERTRRVIEERVRERLGNSLLQRNVVSLVKVRVADVNDQGGATGVLSIWKPNESTLEIMKEGVWIDVLNIVPTAFRHNEIQISAGRQSVLRKCKRENELGNPQTSLDRKCYTIKALTTNPRSKGAFNEIDTCGLIFSIDPPMKDFGVKDEFQNVYLADADKNMICLCFWGGIKKFCFENIVHVDQIVACVNLLERYGNNRRAMPHYRVTEHTYLTLAPKHENSRKLLEGMRKEFAGLDRRKFCKDCLAISKNYAAIKANENVSPYNFSNMDLSKNKFFIESPLVRNVNCNSSAVDFESKFNRGSSDPLSPKALERKRKVREKMNKLKVYGEPPPMSPIPLINKSEDFRRSYVSPLIKDKEVCVASEEKSKICKVEINDKSNVESNSSRSDNILYSPVLKRASVNRVKVNPVKLDFSNNAIQENSSVVDNMFHEDLDSSLPLSLDGY